jgi:superfamily II DNA helicase RecQ
MAAYKLLSDNFVERLKIVIRLKTSLYLLNQDRNCEYLLLKPKQFECLTACLKGNDVICVLPTGYGKSLVYELLPYYYRVYGQEICEKDEKHIVIILTPLNSIIDEQCDKLSHRCIRLDTNMRKILQQDSSLQNVSNRLQIDRFKNCDFFYVIGLPEEVLAESMWPIYKSSQWQNCKSTIFVDEGHCVVMWKTFRPKYEQISHLRSLLPYSNIVILTATASMSMQNSIAKSLLLTSPVTVMSSVDRKNIYLSVVHLHKNRMSNEDVFANCLKPLFDELAKDTVKFAKTIVYCKLNYVGIGYERATIEGLDKLVGMYHAHLPDKVSIKTNKDIWLYLFK